MSNINIAELNKKKGTDLVYTLMVKARQYKDMISLGRGDVDLDTPPNIVEAVNRIIQSGENRQSPVEGLYELREAIARRVKRVNNIDVNPDTDICVTNGG